MTMDVKRTLVQPEDDGTLRVLSPDVGWWSGAPAPGQPLAPGGSVGRLTRLGRRFLLVLPETAHGRVVDLPQEGKRVSVEYGQLLFRLTSTAAAEREAATTAAATGQGPDTDPAVGRLVVAAPTDGTFYHRPSPGAAAYVELNQPVRRGQVVGLVEVMKTFNQIVFDGPGFPDEARVREFSAGEGEEVRAGQALIVLEP